MNAQKKSYEKPKVTEIKLEDKRVVAMAACMKDPSEVSCTPEGDLVPGGTGQFPDPS